MDFFDVLRYSFGHGCSSHRPSRSTRSPAARPSARDSLDEDQAELLAPIVRRSRRPDPPPAAVVHRVRGRRGVRLRSRRAVRPLAADRQPPHEDPRRCRPRHREKRGLWVWYRAVPSRLDALRAVLAELVIATPLVLCLAFIFHRLSSMIDECCSRGGRDWASWFRALGDPTRVLILNLLASEAGR